MTNATAPKRRAVRPITPSLAAEHIAERAYAKWQARGCPIGDGRDDWFAALRELERERVRTKAPRARRSQHAG